MEIRRSKAPLIYIAAISVAVSGGIFFSETNGTVAHNLIAAIFFLPAIAVVTILFRDKPIGAIDASGLSVDAWRVGVIPWSEFRGFTMDGSADGQKVISLHLIDERRYLLQVPPFQRVLTRLRRMSGYGPLMLYPSNIAVPYPNLVAELRRYICELPEA